MPKDSSPSSSSRITRPPTEVLLCSKQEAAASLSISKRTLDGLIANGAFPPPLKIGRASRISYADITHYLDRLRLERDAKITPR